MPSEYPYWHVQSTEKALYPDIEWSKPEQKSRAGHLAIIGGSKQSFLAPTFAYSHALNVGVGSARVLLPSALKKNIPPTITDVIYGETNQSGGLGKSAHDELVALSEWAQQLLFIGDVGQNSETALLYSQFLADSDAPVTIARDAVDILKNDAAMLLDRPATTLVLSFAQLQKIFRAVYYPKVLTFSIQLAQLVENLHKFTTTYPQVSLVTFHQNTLLVAHDGEVASQPWQNAMALWRGDIAVGASVYTIWNPTKPLQAIATSWR